MSVWTKLRVWFGGAEKPQPPVKPALPAQIAPPPAPVWTAKEAFSQEDSIREAMAHSQRMGYGEWAEVNERAKNAAAPATGESLAPRSRGSYKQRD